MSILKAPTNDCERRKQSRLHKLGTNTPHCATCGNSDWRVIEEHHPDSRKRDKLFVLLCANDHRIVTDNQKDHPPGINGCDPFLLSVGNFLLGLADLFAIIIERLYEFGETLITRANEVARKPEGRT
jgi:hypothetical protein